MSFEDYKIEQIIESFTSLIINKKVEKIDTQRTSLEIFISCLNSLIEINDMHKQVHTLYCIDAGDINCHIFEASHSERQFCFNGLIKKNSEHFNSSSFRAIDKLVNDELLFSRDKKRPIFLLRPYVEELFEIKKFNLQKLLSNDMHEGSHSPLNANLNENERRNVNNAIEKLAKLDGDESLIKSFFNDVQTSEIDTVINTLIPYLNVKLLKGNISKNIILDGLLKLDSKNNLMTPPFSDANIFNLDGVIRDNNDIIKVKRIFQYVESLHIELDEDLIRNQHLVRGERQEKQLTPTKRDVEAVLRIHILNYILEKEKLNVRFRLISRSPFIHSLISRINPNSAFDYPLHPFFMIHIFDDKPFGLLRDTLVKFVNKLKVLEYSYNKNPCEQEFNEITSVVSKVATSFINSLSPNVWPVDKKFFKGNDISTGLQQLYGNEQNKKNNSSLLQIINVLRKYMSSSESSDMLNKIVLESLQSDIERKYLETLVSEQSPVIIEVINKDNSKLLPVTIRIRSGNLRIPFLLHSSLQEDSRVNFFNVFKDCLSEGYITYISHTHYIASIDCAILMKRLTKLLELERQSQLKLKTEADEWEFRSSLENDIHLLMSCLLGAVSEYPLATVLLSRRIRRFKPPLDKRIISKSNSQVSSKQAILLMSLKELFLLRQFLERVSAFELPVSHRQESIKNYRRAERDIFYAEQIDIIIRNDLNIDHLNKCLWYSISETDPRLEIALFAGFTEQMYKGWVEGDILSSKSTEQRHQVSKVSQIRMSKDLWFIEQMASSGQKSFTKILSKLEQIFNFNHSLGDSACKVTEGQLQIVEFLAYRYIQINLVVFCVAMGTEQNTPMHSLWYNEKLNVSRHLDFVHLKKWLSLLRDYNEKTKVILSSELKNKSISKSLSHFHSVEFLTIVIGFFVSPSRSKETFKMTIAKLEELLHENDHNMCSRSSDKYRIFYRSLIRRMLVQFKQKCAQLPKS